MALNVGLLFIKYSLLLFLNVGYFWPMSLEVDEIEFIDDKFRVKTIFVRKTYSFKDIVYWKNYPKLSFAILKTSDKFIYLVNKKDLQPFNVIEAYVLTNINILKNVKDT